LYSFVKKDEQWQNHTGNKLTMATALIAAVIGL
jgi:hypothetical protein